MPRKLATRAAKRALRRLHDLGVHHGSAVANFLLFPLAGLAPRNPRRWVFGHQDGEFAGNPKFFYLWTLDRGDVDAIWVTGNWRVWRRLRQLGWPVALRWSPRGMYACATAGAAFFAHRTKDVNAALLNGAFLVNLWHGVGLKAIQLGWEKGRTSVARREAVSPYARARHRTYLIDPDVVATTSDFMQEHFVGQFGLDASRCPQLGYPRLDCAFNPRLAAMAARADVPTDFALRPPGTFEAFMYMPTSRDSNRALLPVALPDPARLNAALAARQAVLYVKLHPRTKERVPAEFDRIRPWPAGVDFQTRLHDFDALITDYSSVLYDYLAVRSSGAVLYTYDLDEYLRTDRTLLYPFVENTAGLRVGSFDALCEAIERGSATALVDEADLLRVRRLFWGGEVGEASPRLFDYVTARLAASTRTQ
jgi:CDP-glycerol glycerophosphotransferase (TagB/SpsB family)